LDESFGQEEDLVIITADVAISRNPHEIEAWKEAGHTVFFLKPGWTHLTFWEQANKFTKYFPEIIKRAILSERAATFTVTVNGKVEPQSFGLRSDRDCRRLVQELVARPFAQSHGSRLIAFSRLIPLFDGLQGDGGRGLTSWNSDLAAGSTKRIIGSLTGSTAH
jgi:hypothetical protein